MIPTNLYIDLSILEKRKRVNQLQYWSGFSLFALMDEANKQENVEKIEMIDYMIDAVYLPGSIPVNINEVK